MSDYAATPPTLSRAQREKEGLYQRFLSWMSMSKPGLWRLRIDIMFINYLVLGVAAVLAPIVLQPFAGIDANAYCGREAARGTCADYESFGGGNYYRWTNGFGVDDIMWTTIVFIITSLVLTIIWAFFVSRGTRLRGLVVQSSFPGFIVVLLVLMPMVILPLLAGMTMFIVTHGGDLTTLFTGVSEVSVNSREFEIAFPGYQHYRGSADRMFSEMLTLLFIFGGFFAFVIAICMKIILADGVLGLVKAIVIAGVLAAITVTIGLFVFQGRTYEHTLTQFSLLLVFGLIYYLSFRISLITNKRRKLSRTIGLSFCMYWIGLFPLLAIFFIQWLGIGPEQIDVWVLLWGLGFIYALFLSFTFRDIARINLLPQP